MSLFTDLRDILFFPKRFFKKEKENLLNLKGITAAISTALVSRLVSTSAHIIIIRMLGEAFKSLFMDSFNIGFDILFNSAPRWQIFQDYWDRYGYYLFDWGEILIWPITTLGKILFSTVIVFTATALLRIGKTEKVHFGTIFLILCYAQLPWVLAIIPVFGSIVAPLLCISIATTALATVYGVSTKRAFFAAASPYFLMFTVVVVGLFVVVALAYHFIHLIY